MLQKLPLKSEQTKLKSLKHLRNKSGKFSRVTIHISYLPSKSNKSTIFKHVSVNVVTFY